MSNGTTNLPTTSHTSSAQSPLNTELSTVGEGIIKRLTSVLEHKVSVTDLSGNIVADSDLSNFDKFIPSSVVAIQNGTHIPLPPDEIDGMTGWIIPLKHQDRLFGTLIIRDDPSPSNDVVPLAKSLTELLLYQMLIMDKIAHENRILDRFFYDLFEKDQPRERMLRDSMFFNSQFFQVDFNQPHIVIVAVLKDFWQDILQNQPVLPSDEHKLTSVKDKIREIMEKNIKIPTPIIAYLGLDEFALLLPYRIQNHHKDDKKSEIRRKHEQNYSSEQFHQIAEQLTESFNRQCYIGVGQYFPEIIGVVRSYRGAKQAVRLGSRLSPKETVFYYADMILPIMLEQSDNSLKKEFVENELSGLIKQTELIETLSTHFNSNLNLKKTAYELGIHKNTLYYRLAKIKKLLGVDPQEFGRAVRLKMALYLWQMSREQEGE